MPQAVMDAFKNLIRHGRNHHQGQGGGTGPKQQPQQQPASQPAQSINTQQQQQQPHQQQRTQGQGWGNSLAQTHGGQSTPPTKELAEKIVQEEREAMNKMPTYKGLERFKLLDKMGDGAFSNVYKALDLQSGEKVAIKVVRKYELNSSQRANILKEVQIMRQINHPSIVKLLSFSESDEHYFLILELMEGGELFHQIVKLTYFSENLSRHVILQVAEGIRFLHEECGVVHRDIKPENLLFERIPIRPSKIPQKRSYDEEKEDEGEFTPGVGGGGIGRVKIADFGLSKIVWNEETMTPCGTVGYTAPEIVKDERYSKSVDMWALGCVLYTLLCGFPPFYDESINVLTEKVARGYYTFLSPWWDDISASAKDLIKHLLCVDPSERYTIDEFLTHPWILGSAPPPEPTPLPPSIPAMPLDSPLLQAVHGGGYGFREGRSPGVATLKEAFDITYAVHRMEEEGAMRRNVAGGARGGYGAGGGQAFSRGLNVVDEDEESDATIAGMNVKYGPEKARAFEVEAGRRNRERQQQQGQQQQRTHGASQQLARMLYEGRAGQRDQPLTSGTSNKKMSHNFDLDLHGATLLGRRHKRERGAIGEPSPLGQQPMVVPVPSTPLPPAHMTVRANAPSTDVSMDTSYVPPTQDEDQMDT
ncbi:MAPK-activated protein kinase Srk1 [Clathrus columnatus]|uniref:MAPK-activated protein kinase Srk1 n=1 Tax=Clathrus columnatus TaxID=1419009 RepID=A0AAV5APB0_9AGAM|nr:MAPK-activated protein kinase Srk1 [Clathrus columnatus]